jgi:hypothetical protein
VLTFRVCGKQQRWEIHHAGETVHIAVTRDLVRRGAAHTFRVRGPDRFVVAEVRDDGGTGTAWLRVEHAGRAMRLRACYAASSTSSRLITIFDADKEWAIRMIRPGPSGTGMPGDDGEAEGAGP